MKLFGVKESFPLLDGNIGGAIFLMVVVSDYITDVPPGWSVLRAFIAAIIYTTAIPALYGLFSRKKPPE